MRIDRTNWLSQLEVGSKVLYGNQVRTIKALQYENDSIAAILTEEDPLQWIGVSFPLINPFLQPTVPNVENR